MEDTGMKFTPPPPLPFCPTQLLVEQKKAKKLIMYWGKDRILS